MKEGKFHLHAYLEGDVIILQKDKYIEDGWYIIQIDRHNWHVFEIPTDGGKEHFIDVFSTISEAYECAINLT